MKADDEGPPDGRWAGASPDAEPHHQQSAGHHHTDKTYGSAVPRQGIASRQVAWWSVHEFVAEVLNQVNGWPMAGTPAWCSLAHDDPRKWAAVLDAGQHWALRMDARQEAQADASKAISDSADWPAIAREINQRTKFRADHPWAKRVAS